MSNDTRYELDHNGNIVEGETTALCSDLDKLVRQLFSQNGWNYVENDKNGPRRNITITNASDNKYILNVFSGKIRNEKRNPYEKKIQLSSSDPRVYQNQETIILGIYVFNENDQLADSIIVGYPIDKDIHYDTNPSLRGVFVNKILQQAKLKGFVVDTSKNLVAFRPEFIFYYLDHYKQIHYSENSNSNIENPNFITRLKPEFERNRIVFGAPGTGKSYKLEEERKELLKGTSETYERVTFHPDYTYSNFVGTYKPVTELIDDGNGKTKSEIRYEFVPGPFLRVYVDALKSHMSQEPQPHLLLIEEINRAKVAAVFGDMFQLLDRNKEGASEYEIHASEEIRNYLAKELGGVPNDFDRIRIPSNMFIWATMNSADQGVFPMDTAFKRRWNFEYLGINNNDNKVIGKINLGKGQYEFEVDWNQLRKAINEKLATELKINEDKLIGPFFLSMDALKRKAVKDDIVESDVFEDRVAENNPTYKAAEYLDPKKFADAFKSKIIMYLYEDVARTNHRQKLFDGCKDCSKYSSVCNEFDEKGIYIFGDDFKNKYYLQEE